MRKSRGSPAGYKKGKFVKEIDTNVELVTKPEPPKEQEEGEPSLSNKSDGYLADDLSELFEPQEGEEPTIPTDGQATRSTESKKGETACPGLKLNTDGKGTRTPTKFKQQLITEYLTTQQTSTPKDSRGSSTDSKIKVPEEKNS